MGTNGLQVSNVPSNKKITTTAQGMSTPVTVDVMIYIATQETQQGQTIMAHQVFNN
jgi:hypothetical protein